MKFNFTLDEAKLLSRLLWADQGKFEECIKSTKTKETQEKKPAGMVLELLEEGHAAALKLRLYIDEAIRKEEP